MKYRWEEKISICLLVGCTILFLIGWRVIKEFTTGIVLEKFRFQHGTECISKNNATNNNFAVNLHEL